MNAAIAATITRAFPGEYMRDLETLLGVEGSDAIASWLVELSAAQLGAGVSSLLFASKSVGAVFGLELDTGARAVLKLFSRQFSASELAAMERCLDVLIARGFPAPRPTTRLFRCDPQLLGAGYEFAAGALEDAHQPWVRECLAQTLAQLTHLLRDFDSRGLCASAAMGPGLWPAPHRTLIDLARSAAGAEPIDARGLRAQRILQASELPRIAAHMDWGTKNARFVGCKLGAVFDWDSLCAASEAEMVGRAAAQFTAQWELPGRLTPSHAEARAFVSAYERARGRRLSSQECVVAAASAEYLIAQVARLEHALGATPGNNYLGLFQECAREPLLEPSRGLPG